jgi:preprotein translocase subunit Sec61beta
MAKRGGKKRQPAPTTAAGLITYFEEEVGGIRIRPEAVVLIAVSLIAAVIIAHVSLPVP